MVDLASSIGTTSIQWGPIILGVLGVLIAVIGWAGRRVLKRIDDTATDVGTLKSRLDIVETNQNWTMDTIQATDRNVRRSARKVGVLPRDLEDTVQRPA